MGRLKWMKREKCQNCDEYLNARVFYDNDRLYLICVECDHIHQTKAG